MTLRYSSGGLWHPRLCHPRRCLGFVSAGFPDWEECPCGSLVDSLLFSSLAAPHLCQPETLLSPPIGSEGNNSSLYNQREIVLPCVPHAGDLGLIVCPLEVADTQAPFELTAAATFYFCGQCVERLCVCMHARTCCPQMLNLTTFCLIFSHKEPKKLAGVPVLQASELVVTYFFCGEEIPYRRMLKAPSLTLGHFKEQLSKKGNYR